MKNIYIFIFDALVSVLMHMVYTCSLILKKMIESLEIVKVISREMRDYPLSHLPAE